MLFEKDRLVLSMDVGSERSLQPGERLVEVV